jgi:NADH dehydrogenase/NADH:ubiquinone oxidoreductase subunit G
LFAPSLATRSTFEQQAHPANVLYEPGKCILCGICVEIAKQSAEPLGLTFIGRGFDVRVGAPMNGVFADGLQKAAAECVEGCPTVPSRSRPFRRNPERRPRFWTNGRLSSSQLWKWPHRSAGE